MREDMVIPPKEVVDMLSATLQSALDQIYAHEAKTFETTEVFGLWRQSVIAVHIGVAQALLEASPGVDYDLVATNGETVAANLSEGEAFTRMKPIGPPNPRHATDPELN